MEELIPLVLMGLGWLFIGLPVTLAQKKKRAQEQANAAQRRATAAAVKPAAAAPAPAAAMSTGSPARESRLAPSISVTRNDDSIYQGSLNAVTGEGYDPCHESMLAAPAGESVPAATGDTARLPFGWTGSDIVRGFVISEVLNRKKAV